jgi:hypothetical protein
VITVTVSNSSRLLNWYLFSSPEAAHPLSMVSSAAQIAAASQRFPFLSRILFRLLSADRNGRILSLFFVFFQVFC